MIRLWQSLSQRIGAAVTRRFHSHERAEFDGSIESLQRAYRLFTDRNQPEEFWKAVGRALETQRRFGVREGVEIAKRILKPFVKVAEAIDHSVSYTIHTDRGNLTVMDANPVRAALNAAMEGEK